MNCDICEGKMVLNFEDSRQEWYEETYECMGCGEIKIKRTEYDQNGDILSSGWI